MFLNYKIEKYAISAILLNTLKMLIVVVMILLNQNILKSQINEIDPKLLQLKAPEIFHAVFETTKGNFEVTAERKYSPLAVDRFYQLIESGYFTDVPFYRVISKFVAQFGTVDGRLDSAWSKHIILDEPVLKSNDSCTIAFARGGKNTRGTQLFINFKNNARLDTVSYNETLGFPVFAYVCSGMETVNSLYSGYGDEPRLKLDSVTVNTPAFIKNQYPKLDYIKKAYIKIKQTKRN